MYLIRVFDRFESFLPKNEIVEVFLVSKNPYRSNFVFFDIFKNHM